MTALVFWCGVEGVAANPGYEVVPSAAVVFAGTGSFDRSGARELLLPGGVAGGGFGGGVVANCAERSRRDTATKAMTGPGPSYESARRGAVTSKRWGVLRSVYVVLLLSLSTTFLLPAVFVWDEPNVSQDRC